MIQSVCYNPVEAIQRSSETKSPSASAIATGNGKPLEAANTMSIANLTFDHNLGQYVAEVTVGSRRIASLMGVREPTPAERAEVAHRLRRLAHTHTRRSNYVPAGTADDAAYRGADG